MNAMRQCTINASNRNVSNRVTDIFVAADSVRTRLSVLSSRVVFSKVNDLC